MQLAQFSELREGLQALPSWQGVLVVLGSSLLVAVVVHVGGDVVLRRLTRKIPGEIDDIVLGGVHLPLYVSVLVAGGYVSVELLEAFEAWLPQIRATLLTLLTLLWAFALARIGRRVSAEATRNDHFDKQVVPIFQNVWTALLLGATIFLVLTYWRVNITPLLASAGVLGIVLGLAARDTIANLFGSLALYADRTYAVGDFIVLESGERGRVEDISIRSTDIRTRDDLLVTVPNSVLNTATIVNESTPERERRLRIPLSVAYESDLDHVEEVLLDVADREAVVLDEPEPRVRVREFADSAVDVELLFWVSAPVLRGRAKHAMFKRIHARFREEGIEIPYPQRVVTMTDDGSAENGELETETSREADIGTGDSRAETAAEAGTDGSRTDQEQTLSADGEQNQRPDT